jgi:hypothetical protein
VDRVIKGLAFIIIVTPLILGFCESKSVGNSVNEVETTYCSTTVVLDEIEELENEWAEPTRTWLLLNFNRNLMSAYP